MHRDSVGGTFLIAGVLCVVCSVLVAGVAELLKDTIETNRALDKQRNVLLAAGLCDKSASADLITDLYSNRIKPVAVDLNTGKRLADDEVSSDYDEVKALAIPDQRSEVEPSAILQGLRYRANVLYAFEILGEGEEGSVTGYVLPVQGKGLWSTLKGFIAVAADGETVLGLTFYEHKETPGLGGEVDNAGWKAKWPGKKIYDQEGKVALSVIKGSMKNEYEVDGLSGATITSKGVDGIVKYWLGPNGFGPFIESQAEARKQFEAAAPGTSKGTYLAGGE